MTINKFKYLFFIALVVAGCHKTNRNVPTSPLQGGGEKDSVYSFNCKNIGMGPAIGWQDVNLYSDSALRCWFYNPVNKNEIIFAPIGDMNTGYHKVCSYNFITKTRKTLDAGCMYFPQISSKGWIVYEDLNFNIYKIKANGDSLTKLCEGEDPKWDYTGNFIYYCHNSNPSRTYKMDINGNKIDSLNKCVFFAAFGKQSNICAYMDISNGVGYVNLKNLINNSETRLLTGNQPNNKALSGFQGLQFDNYDQNLFWYNDYGIYRCNLAGKIDTVISSCNELFYNYRFYNGFIVPGIDKMTFVYELRSPLNSVQLYHQYKAFEYDLFTKKLRQVIF